MTQTSKEYSNKFYKELARVLGLNESTVKRYYIDGIYEVIVRLLHFEGKCTLPHLGTIITTYQPGVVQRQTDVHGETHTYNVSAREKPEIVFHDDFINDINFMGLTKAYRKRVKNNRLTTNDYRREQRIATLGDYGSISPERKQAAKEEFQNMLDGILEKSKVESGDNECQTE